VQQNAVIMQEAFQDLKDTTQSGKSLDLEIVKSKTITHKVLFSPNNLNEYSSSLVKVKKDLDFQNIIYLGEESMTIPNFIKVILSHRTL